MLATAQDHELDGGPGGKAGLERLCALTRTPKPVADMIRFVVGPDGGPVPDLKRKLPGRGVWITAERASLAEAIRRNVFSRSFKRELQVSAHLCDLTERLLMQSALDALAIAGKAGQVAAGFTRVEAALGDDSLVALIHAADAAEDGIRKLDAVLRQQSEQKGREIPIIRAFSSAQLDFALNRINVIHAALLAGPVSDSFLTRTRRFLHFRDGCAAETKDEN